MQAGVLPRQRALFAAIFALLCTPFASAQKRINCPNGETHYEIDVEKLALNYQGRSFQTTLSGLGALGAKVALQPTTLQAADVATQQWNQLLQGLAAGFNSCAVTQAQYNEGLQKIYPRLKDDTAELEKIRQALAKSQAVDRQRFQSILDSYFANLRRFADAGNLGLILQAKGDLEGAQRYSERALAIDEKVYGPDHPTVAIRAGNLGQILQANGDLEGAQRYLQKAYSNAEKRLGAQSPETRVYAAALADLKTKQ
jgi:tetratricopeptide (TPR) repeat protein